MERRGEVADPALVVGAAVVAVGAVGVDHPDGERGARQPAADRGGKVGAGGAVFELPLGAVGQGHAHGSGDASRIRTGDIVPVVIRRVLLFAAYAFLGAVLSYGLVYLFSPMGFAIVVAGVLLVSALPRAGGSRWPEALGLLAGPGLLLMLGDATVRAPGAAIVALAVVGYGLAGRARCTRVA